MTKSPDYGGIGYRRGGEHPMSRGWTNLHQHITIARNPTDASGNRNLVP